MLQDAIARTRSLFDAALPPITDWALAAAILIVAAIVALLLHAALLWLARRAMGERETFLRTVMAATRGPTRVGLLLVALAIALPATPLAGATASLLARLLGLGTIFLLGWVALTALHIGADLYLRRYWLDLPDNLLARKHITQVRILERVVAVMIVFVTIGFALLTFDAVRQFGVTLFASAGVAGIIAGLAARPVLSNFLAGVQIAVSQPIRIDDAVIVENKSGTIEEITFSYVVVKLWDFGAWCAAQLFHRKAISELDQDRRRAHRQHFLLCRPHRTGRSDPRETDGDRHAIQTLERQGRQLASQRLQRDERRVARPGERRHRGGGMGPALRSAREADRFSAARLPHRAAAPALRSDRERCGQSR